MRVSWGPGHGSVGGEFFQQPQFVAIAAHSAMFLLCILTPQAPAFGLGVPKIVYHWIVGGHAVSIVLKI